jgi:hypothetical protein
MSQAPLDNFKFMAAENICTSRPNFYITWAWELEQADNFKGAEKVKLTNKPSNLSTARPA